jgi:YD repeat-containing protein
MRRGLGISCTGLGAFFLVLALLLRFYLPAQLIKFPLNEYRLTTLTGQGISYFSQGRLKEIRDAAVQATSTLEGDVAAGTSALAVWNEFTAVNDITNNGPIQYLSQRSAFGRRSGLITDCCGAFVSISNLPASSGHQSGLAYAWPIGTQPVTYQVFDPFLRGPEPYRYQGTATTDGMTSYKFVEQVTNQRFAAQTLPGSLLGLPGQPSVTLPEYLTETNTDWVDPATGTVLSATQNRTLSLEDNTGATRLVLFQGSLTATPASVASAVSAARSLHLKIEGVADIGPLVAVLLGIILLVVGVALSVARLNDDQFAYEDDEPVGSAF